MKRDGAGGERKRGAKKLAKWHEHVSTVMYICTFDSVYTRHL